MPADVIYLDNNATTRCDPRVVQAMLPFFGEHYGNPASRTHAFGWEAREAIDAARTSVAACVGGRATDVIFTSGATESNGLAILGLMAHPGTRGQHVVSQVTEHKSVLDVLDIHRSDGGRVTLVGVDAQGRVDAARVAEALTDETALVSIMAANNEIGTLQPLAAIGAICGERGIPFHVDAAQGAGRLDLDLCRDGIDLLSLSAHKLYGPKGVGALIVRKDRCRPRLLPRIHGGGHEGGLRSGTLGVPGIVGLATAIDVLGPVREAEAARGTELARRILEALRAALPGVLLNGPEPGQDRLPGNLNVAFQGVEADANPAMWARPSARAGPGPPPPFAWGSAGSPPIRKSRARSPC